MKSLLLAVLIVGTSVFYAHAQSSSRSERHTELGSVNWGRDLDTAVASSKKMKKPIAILFQEVPG